MNRKASILNREAYVLNRVVYVLNRKAYVLNGEVSVLNRKASVLNGKSIFALLIARVRADAVGEQSGGLEIAAKPSGVRRSVRMSFASGRVSN